jgi:hypothetical protein
MTPQAKTIQVMASPCKVGDVWTARLIEKASTHALGWILQEHCRMTWGTHTLRIIFQSNNRMAHELLHEDDTQRRLQSWATEIAGRAYTVDIIDIPPLDHVTPAPEPPMVPLVSMPETAPMPEPTTRTYRELLRDPRWQRKRLEIMQREQFACQNCGATDLTLNVHHGYYEKGRKPWEYPSETLHCLCEPCHAEVQSLLLVLQALIGQFRTAEALRRTI